MKRAALILFLPLIILFPLVVLGGIMYQNQQHEESQSAPDHKQFSLLLKRARQQSKLTLKSYFHDPLHEKTEVYVGNQKTPQVVVDGILFQAYSLDINGDYDQELNLQVISGKLINSLVYRYDNGELVKIPVSTERPPSYYGTVTHNLPLFKDEDGDGVMELFAYYAHGEPEAKRTVEAYKFNGQIFDLTRRYEENMPEIYL